MVYLLLGFFTTIDINDRNKLLNQTPFILWFTGLSASGKSTIANIVEKKLFEMNYKTYLLDGDNVRHGLNKDLGFNETSRVMLLNKITSWFRHTVFLKSNSINFTNFTIITNTCISSKRRNLYLIC